MCVFSHSFNMQEITDSMCSLTPYSATTLAYYLEIFAVSERKKLPKLAKAIISRELNDKTARTIAITYSKNTTKN